MSDDSGLKSGRPRDSSIDDRVLVVARKLLAQNGLTAGIGPVSSDGIDDGLPGRTPMLSKSAIGAAFSPTVYTGTRCVMRDTENHLT